MRSSLSMGSGVSLVNQTTYEVWSQALSEFFFHPKHAQRPVYLQVDRETMPIIGAKIGVAQHQAETEFAEVVRSRLCKKTYDPNPFKKIIRQTDVWKTYTLQRNPSSFPPFVGLLALCVLAASRMSNDPDKGISSGNYYVWLNELLGLRSEGQPPYFETVTEFWPLLNWWLDQINHGNLGLPTAKPHQTLTHIGYPLSQCLLNGSDRERLADFFRWEGIAPGDSRRTEEIARGLRIWATRTTCSLGSRAQRILMSGDQGLIEQIAEVTLGELRLWNGSALDIQGRRSARIVLRMEIREGGRHFACELVPEAPEGFPEGEYRVEGKTINANRESGTSWFTPLPDYYLERSLTQGLVLRHGDFALVFEPAPVIVFGEHPSLEGWVSQERVTLSHEHVVLCHVDYKERVQEFLTLHASDGWRPPTDSLGLPSSWVCFRRVKLLDPVRDAPDTTDLDCLVPHPRVGIHFHGGLKLRELVWLKGGEPDVQISAPDLAEPAILLDNRVIAKLSNGGASISLKGLGLAIGSHEISVGNRPPQKFLICEPVYRPSGHSARGALGHEIHHDGSQFFAGSMGVTSVPDVTKQSGSVIVVGASVQGLSEGVSLLTRRRVDLSPGYQRHVILGRRPGEVLEVKGESQLKRGTAKKTITVFFEPQWLIKVGRKHQLYLSSLGKLRPPENAIADRDTLDLWIRWVTAPYMKIEQPRQCKAIWSAYERLASKVAGGCS